MCYVHLTMLGEDTWTKQSRACAWGSVRLDGGLVCGLGCAQRPSVPSCLQRRHIGHVRKYFSWVRLTSRHLGPWLPLAPSVAQSSPGALASLLPPSQYPWLLQCHPSAPQWVASGPRLRQGQSRVPGGGGLPVAKEQRPPEKLTLGFLHMEELSFFTLVPLVHGSHICFQQVTCVDHVLHTRRFKDTSSPNRHGICVRQTLVLQTRKLRLIEDLLEGTQLVGRWACVLGRGTEFKLRFICFPAPRTCPADGELLAE